MAELKCRMPHRCVGKVKFVVVGDSGVGKTCFFMTYNSNKFPSKTDLNVHYWFIDYTRLVFIDGKQVHFSLFDSVGTEEYKSLRPRSYLKSDVFLIFFSLVDRKSFENVKNKWVPELKSVCPKVPIILVGTKLDLLSNVKLNESNAISFNEGLSMANEIGAKKYLEFSSLTQEGLKSITEEAINIALFHRPKKKSHCSCVLL